MPSDLFHPGDHFECKVTVWNDESFTLNNHPLFVILDLWGSYYFAPGFSDFEFYSESFPPGEKEIIVVPEFVWPENIDPASGVYWYAALTDSTITSIYGFMDSFKFSGLF